MYDILIIGAGPSGLSAAIYARRASKKVLVLEALTYGGQIINAKDIANYPGYEHISGYDYAIAIYNQAKNLGAEIKFEKAINIIDHKDYKEVVTPKETYQGKTIIIATGSSNKKLGIEREEMFIGRGISYCATCDGNFYKGKDVAVVGGNNTAIEDVEYLANIANKVYLIHKQNYFDVSDNDINKIKSKKNIELILNSSITKLLGDNQLDGVEISDKNGNTKKISISCIFLALGRVPETGEFSKLINTNEKGYFIANENCHTNIEGIFVAGDSREKNLRQLVTATSDGAIAATEAVKYLNK